MLVEGTNNIQKNSYGCNCCTCMPNGTAQNINYQTQVPQQQAPVQCSQAGAYAQPVQYSQQQIQNQPAYNQPPISNPQLAYNQQPVYYQQPPQYQQPQMQQNSGQTLQIPSNTSGVNIQIFNPSVTPPGAQAPTYNVNAPNYYPPNYYTGTIGANGNNNQGGCNCNCNGANGNGRENDLNNVNNSNNETKNNIETSNTEDNKKTEKKKIVELTDQYIMNLESYLNSQEKDIRLSAAKEVYARLEEDPSRKDDKALTALINKMLQDPDSEIRLIALGALDGRYCTGDDYTVNVLQKMQSINGGYSQDAVDAAEILLKMSARQVEKEVPVDPQRQKKTVKTEKKTEVKKD